MVASWFEKWFGAEEGGRGMGAALLQTASVYAQIEGRAESDVIHLVEVVLKLVEVRKALEARGVNVDDALAVVEQLVAELPVVDANRTSAPPRSAALDALAEASVQGRHLSAARMIEETAARLPVELGFLARALRGAALEVGPLFDARISTADNNVLTFEAWDPELRGCVGLMQKLSDTRWPVWIMGPTHLFLTVLSTKIYYQRLTARGVDITELIRELGASIVRPARPVRDRPEGYVPGISASLFAAFLRAERYAAEDASEVRLRHLLASLHDEVHLAPFVERLAG